MATASATVTAKTGPAVQNTAIPISDVASINIDVARQVVTFNLVSGRIREYDLTGVTTLTDTITSGNHVIVVS